MPRSKVTTAHPSSRRRASSHARSPSAPSATEPPETLRFPRGEAQRCVALSVFINPAQSRLDAALRDNRRLFRAVEKRKASFASLRETAQCLFSAVERTVGSIAAECDRLEEETKQLFDDLLASKSRLRPSEKLQIRRLRSELGLGPPTDEPSEAWADGSSFSQGEEEEEPVSTPHSRGPRSAFQPEGNLRELFRRLAILLHPDKARDEATREHFSAMMKQVTQAYSAGDMAELLAIERAHHQGRARKATPESPFDAQLRRLLEANQGLNTQLKVLNAELRAERADLPFEIDLRRSKAATLAMAEPELRHLALQAERGRRQLEETHQFVLAFVEGKFSLGRFLRGPRPAGNSSFERDLEAMLAEVHGAKTPPPQGRGRSTTIPKTKPEPKPPGHAQPRRRG